MYIVNTICTIVHVQYLYIYITYTSYQSSVMYVNCQLVKFQEHFIFHSFVGWDEYSEYQPITSIYILYTLYIYVFV